MSGNVNAITSLRCLVLILFCLIPRTCAQATQTVLRRHVELRFADLQPHKTLMPARFQLLRTIDDEEENNDAWLRDLKRYRLQALQFYASLGDQLAWVRDSKPTPQAWAVINILKHADSKGLRPNDYGCDEWDADLQLFYEKWELPRWPVVRFDIALTVHVMRYLSDLHGGRVNPQLLHLQIGPPNTQLDLVSLLLELIDSTNVARELEGIEPPFPAYKRTLIVLDQYLQLAKADPGRTLPLPTKAIHIGDSFANAEWLAERLRLFGDLKSDSSVAESIYSSALSEGVKHFQQRYGLSPTGFLDKETVKALNVPISVRIKQLNLTLERWRWVRPSFASPPIVVNIPEFRLHTNDQSYHWLLSARVVVGKAYRHQTPVFASELKTVIFRPYWSVPTSIAQQEILPLIAKEPNYLNRHGFQAVDKRGKLVAANLVTGRSLSSGQISIRQKPGAENALGLIKFEFPNHYGVYMHGTPETQLFIQSRRDFSHGCIRLENPEMLAQAVLADNPKWTLNEIQSAMKGQKTIRVNLKKPVPVLVVYGTAVVMEDGEVHFFSDIYQQDLKLEKALLHTRVH